MAERDEIFDGIGERLRRLQAVDPELPETWRKLLEALEKAEADASAPPRDPEVKQDPPRPHRTGSG